MVDARYFTTPDTTSDLQRKLLKEAVKRGKDDFAKTREELIEALKQAGKDFLAESY